MRKTAPSGKPPKNAGVSLNFSGRKLSIKRAKGKTAKIKNPTWVDEFSGAVTVCDKKGIIIYMNKNAEKTFKKDSGRKLIGSNVLDCHPPSARNKLKRLMAEEKTNAYTIEKNGVKKLIYQSPWYARKKYMGFVEVSLEIPKEMPHFIRGTPNRPKPDNIDVEGD